MNHLVTKQIEKTLALGFHVIRGRNTPNPFRPVRSLDLSWMDASPEEFYSIPDQPPRLDFNKNLLSVSALRDRFTFTSSYLSGDSNNNLVHGLANLRSEGKARAALIIVHGHAMTNFKLLERYARPAIRSGMDVYLIALPYHMQRAPRGTWSGQCSLNSDIEGSALAFIQGVRDVRSLISWIEVERQAPVVLLGVSLGAYTSCMTAVVDDRPKAVVSIIGGGSLAQILWDGYQMGRSKRQLMAGGVSQDQLEQYWALLGPANWLPKIARDRILLLAGEFDPIVTPENVNRLWRAWDHPAIHWYPCGHATISIYHRQVRKEIFRFLHDRI